MVGAGADTIQYLLDQIATDYDTAHPNAASLLYSFDITNPGTGKPGGKIETKAKCAAIARPDGSSAGISALEANTMDPASPSHFCVDYAGSTRGPSASDPPCAPGGICFVPLAGDAVTWASRDAANGGTDAPASLTLIQLRGIYRCTITNWATVGGKNAPIKPFLPQTSSGTRAFWLTAIGVATPGPCVSDNNNTLQDNQGLSKVLNSPEAIVPYSVAGYLAQVYHDAPCTKPSCTGSPQCVPAGSQNVFGCDQHGVLGINEIGGSKPVRPWPLPASPCAHCTINPKFTSQFQRIVYVVIRDAATADKIPAYLEPFFAAKTAVPAGFACQIPTGDLTVYGFVPASSSRAFGDARRAPPQCGIPQH